VRDAYPEGQSRGTERATRSRAEIRSSAEALLARRPGPVRACAALACSGSRDPLRGGLRGRFRSRLGNGLGRALGSRLRPCGSDRTYLYGGWRGGWLGDWLRDWPRRRRGPGLQAGTAHPPLLAATRGLDPVHRGAGPTGPPGENLDLGPVRKGRHRRGSLAVHQRDAMSLACGRDHQDPPPHGQNIAVAVIARRWRVQEWTGKRAPGGSHRRTSSVVASALCAAARRPVSARWFG
jgi:hypothetical protein